MQDYGERYNLTSFNPTEAIDCCGENRSDAWITMLKRLLGRTIKCFYSLVVVG